MSALFRDDTSTARSLRQRIAGAPISWGVCEVPGWGYQLAPERVLGEMRSLGLAATEFGPVGFLADDPAAKARQLKSLDLVAVGGFLPLLMHDPDHDPLPETDAFVDGCLAAGAGVMVLAAFTGVEGYDDRPVLDDRGWQTMLTNLDRLADHAQSRGIAASLHPHVGTMVETADEVERVLQGSHVGLCADTGHLYVGGADPVALVTAYADRVNHVHLKDVDSAIADLVVTGQLSFGDAVRQGIFRPLGQGDIDIARLVRVLESAGYQGWYVLEQDVMLPAEPHGVGPVAHVQQSLDYLVEVAA
ncbi:MAG: TIM barrel protein [Nocardioidaceae bacterium]